MSRTVYVASRPTSELPLPRTRLLGTSFARQSYNSPNPHHTTEHCVLETNPDHRPPVRIIASRKRRRTVTARLRSGVLELLVPASMPLHEREHWAEVMSRRLARRAERSRPSDERLDERARILNDRHFEGALRWTTIGFADMAFVGQLHLHGRCDPDRTPRRLSAGVGARLPAHARARTPRTQRSRTGIPRAGEPVSAGRTGEGLP